MGSELRGLTRGQLERAVELAIDKQAELRAENARLREALERIAARATEAGFVFVADFARDALEGKGT